MNVNFKSKKGVSLMALIITVVVILVISIIFMRTSSNIPDEAHFTKYLQVMKNVQTGIENEKINNSRKGTTEEKLTVGFKKVILENAPTGFVSFDDYDEPISGYLVDLETIGYVEAEYGRAFKNYSEGSILKFGEKEYDVFVFDEEWTVYYVKGLEYNDSMNYTFK